MKPKTKPITTKCIHCGREIDPLQRERPPCGRGFFPCVTSGDRKIRKIKR